MLATRYRLVVFDLDGTLVDSRHDIAHSANLTLGLLGLPTLPPDTIIGFVGGGVRNLALRSLTAAAGSGTAIPSPEEFVARFLPIYAEHLLDRTLPYSGVVDTLAALDAASIAMAVVTNKPAEPARRIVEGLGLGPFALIVGGDSAPTRKPDPEPLLRAVRHVGAEVSETLYVGDMGIDVETASAAAVRFVGVTWGLASRADLAAAGARELIDRMTDLVRLAGVS